MLPAKLGTSNIRTPERAMHAPGKYPRNVPISGILFVGVGACVCTVNLILRCTGKAPQCELAMAPAPRRAR
eukprot:602055-Prymnesium_polylepis.1